MDSVTIYLLRLVGETRGFTRGRDQVLQPCKLTSEGYVEEDAMYMVSLVGLPAKPLLEVQARSMAPS